MAIGPMSVPRPTAWPSLVTPRFHFQSSQLLGWTPSTLAMSANLSAWVATTSAMLPTSMAWIGVLEAALRW